MPAARRDCRDKDTGVRPFPKDGVDSYQPLRGRARGEAVRGENSVLARMHVPSSTIILTGTNGLSWKGNDVLSPDQSNLLAT